MSLFTMTITIFMILDSVGNITDFLHLIRDLPLERQKPIILREMLFAFLIMIFFALVGDYILDALHLAPETVQIAGGIVLFLISIKMVFLNQGRMFTAIDKSEPFMVPIATPMIAGPSALATIMFYSYTEHSSLELGLAILMAWAATVIVLLLAYQYRARVSGNILMALEKLMGLILILMYVEMFLKGLKTFMLLQTGQS
jgi:multiple antibiotic resistance protein